MKWLLVVSCVLLFGSEPVPAGSFNRLPNPPAAKPETTGSTPAASPPAAMADATAPAESSNEKAAEGSEKEANAADSAETSANTQTDTETAEAEEEIVPEGEPTYGEVCIYGPRGVVHSPPGRDCEAEQTQRDLEVSEAEPAADGTGRCIFGADEEVVYAPPGSNCEGRVRQQERPVVKTRPRARRYRPGY